MKHFFIGTFSSYACETCRVASQPASDKKSTGGGIRDYLSTHAADAEQIEKMAPDRDEGKVKGSAIKSSGRPLEAGLGAAATRGGGAHNRGSPVIGRGFSAVDRGPQGSGCGSPIMGRETSIASKGIVTVVMEQDPMTANGAVQVSGQA